MAPYMFGKQGLYALYVRNSEIKEALAVSLYRRSCRILPIKEAVQMNGYRAPWPAPFGTTSPSLLDMTKMLLPMASSDMAAMRDLAKMVSIRADAPSLQMVVAQLPDGPATTFDDGQTMLHVLLNAVNEHIKACLAVLIDLGVPLAIMDDNHSTALALCSDDFVEGQVLLTNALTAQSGDTGHPQVPVDVRECAICMQQAADSVLVPCGHLCVCHHCAPRLQGLCPICRANTSQVLRVYHS